MATQKEKGTETRKVSKTAIVDGQKQTIEREFPTRTLDILEEAGAQTEWKGAGTEAPLEVVYPDGRPNDTDPLTEIAPVGPNVHYSTTGASKPLASQKVEIETAKAKVEANKEVAKVQQQVNKDK